MSYRRDNCRFCKGKNLVKFLDLGAQPLSGGFLTKEQLASEKFYPLELHICKDCLLVQVLDVIDKETLFKEYFYLSSVTKTLSQHFIEYAKILFDKFLKNPNSFLVEIGSNDGVLLRPLNNMGIRTLGVEPATNVGKIAESFGVETVNDFFTEKVAAKIAKGKGKADVITGSNVFAHIDDLDDVMRGIKVLLKDDGVFIFEVHYLMNLIEELQYDMVYHEHMNYYILPPLMIFFKKFDMEIFDAERIPMHAGGIRVYVRNIGKRNESISENVQKLLDLEKKNGLHEIGTYLKFGERVRKLNERLLSLLVSMKSHGNKIIGYGASGRANTILNYCKTGPEILEYIVDASPLRQGRYTPGTHIPIVAEDRFRNDNPDYVLLLAWSYAKEIIEKEKVFVEKGGKFIIPFPEIKIVP